MPPTFPQFSREGEEAERSPTSTLRQCHDERARLSESELPSPICQGGWLLSRRCTESYKVSCKNNKYAPKRQLRAPEEGNIDFKTNSQTSKALLVIASSAGCSAEADGWMFYNSRPVRAGGPSAVSHIASCLVENFKNYN